MYLRCMSLACHSRLQVGARYTLPLQELYFAMKVSPPPCIKNDAGFCFTSNNNLLVEWAKEVSQKVGVKIKL